GDWFSALDLQDAYFHITIHPTPRRFLRFTLGTDHYQYRVLPFGLSTTLRVFSNILTVVVAHFHKQGVIIPYLDDCLLKGPTWAESFDITQWTIVLFLNLGIQINKQKSTLISVQQLHFIRAHLDSTEAKASIPTNRFLTMTSLISSVLNSPHISTHQPPTARSYGDNHICGTASASLHVLHSGLAQNCIHTTQTQPKQTPDNADKSQRFSTLVNATQPCMLMDSLHSGPTFHDVHN
ncbi:ORF 3, partial [Chelydra serpentina]